MTRSKITSVRLVGVTAPLPGTCRIEYAHCDAWYVEPVALLVAAEATDVVGRIWPTVVPVSWAEAESLWEDALHPDFINERQFILSPSAEDAAARASRLAEERADYFVSRGHRVTAVELDSDDSDEQVPSPLGSGLHYLAGYYAQHAYDCPVDECVEGRNREAAALAELRRQLGADA